MSKLRFGLHGPIVVPYEFLYSGNEHDPSYSRGFLGSLPEELINGIITEGETGELVHTGDSWEQKFSGSISGYKGAFAWSSVPGAPQLIGELGAFDLRLIKRDATNENWDIEIVIKFKLNLFRDISQYVAVSETMLFSNFMNNARIAIQDYWGGAQLVSNSSPLTVNIIPTLVDVTSDEHYDVTIYPDDETDLDFFKQWEKVQFGIMSDSWYARETKTFSRWKPGASGNPGNGPHEYGHMMGVPHDYYELDSVMYSTPDMAIGEDDLTEDELQFRYGGDNKPWASHYRIIQLWAEKTFRKGSVLGERMELKVQLPW